MDHSHHMRYIALHCGGARHRIGVYEPFDPPTAAIKSSAWASSDSFVLWEL